jgi:murein DD-endopeptidase MepM/ murein hydrolase activator NlpD
MVPVEGVAPASILNTFHASRGSRSHNAHDIMARRGTPVLAADEGRILRLASNELGGITIYATDPREMFVYYYAHLDGYAKGLAEGKLVHKGQLIGYVGSTGNATANAPHLHFQVARIANPSRYWEGVPIDARLYFALAGKRR